MITELNDSSYVTFAGTEGNCTWCDGYWGGTRARGQTVEVATVNGTNIGIQPALYSDYSHAPLASPFSAGAKYAGLENLQIYANNTGYGENILMQSAAYCWVQGVECNYTDGDHVEVYFSYRCEIRDSYFSNAYFHTPGTHDSDIVIASKSSGILVENNILERLHGSIMLEWGASGNVIGYNYSMGDFDAGATNVLMMDLSIHGAHPDFNLWEGNIVASLHPDSMWGSSSHNTAFRNWVKGTTQICNPTSGRGTVQWSACWWAVQANRAINLDQLGRYYNFVGDVVGSSETANLKIYNGTNPMPQVSMVIAPQTRSYDAASYSYSFGYGETNDLGTGAGDNSLPYTTALLHGNFDNVTSTTTWSGSITHTLPASFYKFSKPSWFGSTPWPAIGPDVAGGLGPGGHAYAIPAQACYNKTPKDSNGILLFDANACYCAPPAPLNLRVIR
jgi:hypothetical protein